MKLVNRISGNLFFEGDPPAPPTPPPPPPPPSPARTFTQDEVNRFVSQQHKALLDKNQELVGQLEALQQNKSLTEEERTNLQTQIDQLKSTYETKEQQAKIQYDKDKKKWETTEKTLSTERDAWKTRFEQTGIDNEIATEFAADAINIAQIRAILKPVAKYTEVLDEGKPTGRYQTTVDFEGRDTKGNPVPLKGISLKDAKKAMLEQPDLYGNLFKNTANGGTGVSPAGTASNGKIGDIDKMSPAEYAKHREEIRSKMAESKVT